MRSSTFTSLLVATVAHAVVAATLAAAIGAAPATAAPPPAASTTASTTSAAPTSGTSATPSATAGARNNMDNCPSVVDGAAVAAKDIPGGVELTITGAGDAVAQIRTRAKALVDASKSTAGGTRHDRKGDGGGRTGRCPVVMFKTAVTTADVDGGVALTVKADYPADVDWLRKETRERVEERAAAGAGHGKMSHCPSALDGAATLVKDTADGVVVVVTGKGDVVKAIRARTADLLAAAARPENALGHSGNGQGGGGFGRCPVIVMDTSLTAKDVDGGSQITVVTKKPADLAALQKEAHDRAARFGPPASPAPAPGGAGGK